MSAREVEAAVHDVFARYAAGIDDTDWERFRACFVEDAVFPGFGPDPIEGVDAWIAFVQKTLAPFRATQHLIGRPVVEAAGDALVRARAPLQAQHFYSAPRGRLFSVWGSYRSELVAIDGLWRLQRHRLEVQATETRDLQALE